MSSPAAAGRLAVFPNPGLSSLIARYLPRKLAFILGVLLVCAILSAGLWPFHAPRNNAHWLPDRNGLAFALHGVALTSAALPAGGRADASTLEILLAPEEAWRGGTVLSLFDPATSSQLALRQNYTDLVVQRRIGTRRYASSDLTVEEVFRRPVFLVTLSSDGSNTLVYINGELAANSPTFAFSAKDLERQIIVGTSALQPDSWSGEVRGLALYRSQLDAASVAQHYRDHGRTSAIGAPADGSCCVSLRRAHRQRRAQPRGRRAGAGDTSALHGGSSALPGAGLAGAPHPGKLFEGCAG
jgi:hypothetical protein